MPNLRECGPAGGCADHVCCPPAGDQDVALEGGRGSLAGDLRDVPHRSRPVARLWTTDHQLAPHPLQCSGDDAPGRHCGTDPGRALAGAAGGLGAHIRERLCRPCTGRHDALRRTAPTGARPARLFTVCAQSPEQSGSGSNGTASIDALRHRPRALHVNIVFWKRFRGFET